MQVQHGNCYYEYRNFFFDHYCKIDTQNYYCIYPFVHVMHTLRYFILDKIYRGYPFYSLPYGLIDNGLKNIVIAAAPGAGKVKGGVAQKQKLHIRELNGIPK